MRGRGVALRPHLKTAKSAAVARLATRNEAGGITVSTVAEAEYFVEHGFLDVLMRLPGSNSRSHCEAHHRGATITLIADHPALAERIAEHRAPFRALVEIDSGDRRAGVDSGSDALLDVATAMGDKLVGVMTHAGHSYDCRDVSCVKAVAEEERAAVVRAAERLRAAGLRVEVVSVGSTPTMTHADRLDGVTEGRPGVYMFHDLFQAAIGSCTTDDIALTVLASVIGIDTGENRFLVDAGALALSKDRSTQVTPTTRVMGKCGTSRDNRLADGCKVERAWSRSMGS